MLEPISGQSGVGPHLKKFATKTQIVNNVRLTYRHIFVVTCMHDGLKVKRTKQTHLKSQPHDNVLIGQFRPLPYEYSLVSNRQYNIFPLYFEPRENIIIQIQPFYEVDTSLYRPKICISTEDVVRGRYTSLGRYTICIE
jgi:hypothetical protein